MANGYEKGDYLAQFLNQLPQIYQAKKNAELQRERFNYYKDKDAQALKEKEEAKLYNRNNQAWTQMQQFAGQLPFGQRTKFLQKQIEILPQDFVEGQSLNKFIENYQTLEDNEVEQQSMFENLDFEDSPDKIDKAIELGLIQDPRRVRMLKSRSTKLKEGYLKQKPFDINKLSYNEQRIYNVNESLLSDAEKELSLASQGLPGKSPDPKAIVTARKRVEKYQSLIQPFVKKGSPISTPEFTYSAESLKAINEDDDLRSSFFADASNDMDAFIASQRGPEPDPDPDPEPDPEKDKGIASKSIWESYDKKTIVPTPGGFKTVMQKDFRLKSDAPERYKSNFVHRQEEAQLKQQISDLEKQIESADNNLAQISRVVEKRIVKAGMGPTSIIPVKQGELAREKALLRKKTIEEQLAEVLVQYEKIRRPFPEIIRDEP
jgi:hypothetical protein